MEAFHLEEIQKHCRVCGRRLKHFRVSYSCQKRSEELSQAFGLTISDDMPDTHPASFCHGCYTVLMRSQKARAADKQYAPSLEVFSWAQHMVDGQCTIYEHLSGTAAGGRRAKKRRSGCPPLISVTSAINHLYTTAPASFFPTAHSLPRVSIPSSTNLVQEGDLLCQLCSTLVDRPVHLMMCNNLVCMTCLCRALEEAVEFRCPCCDEEHIHDNSTMIPPAPVVMKVLGSFLVSCDICHGSILTV